MGCSRRFTLRPTGEARSFLQNLSNAGSSCQRAVPPFLPQIKITISSPHFSSIPLFSSKLWPVEFITARAHSLPDIASGFAGNIPPLSLVHPPSPAAWHCARPFAPLEILFEQSSRPIDQFQLQRPISREASVQIDTSLRRSTTAHSIDASGIC